MSHDRCCPLDNPALECAVCDAIAAARSEEKATAQAIWKANLHSIESRNYLAGWHDRDRRRPIASWVEQ